MLSKIDANTKDEWVTGYDTWASTCSERQLSDIQVSFEWALKQRVCNMGWSDVVQCSICFLYMPHYISLREQLYFEWSILGLSKDCTRKTCEIWLEWKSINKEICSHWLLMKAKYWTFMAWFWEQQEVIDTAWSFSTRREGVIRSRCARAYDWYTYIAELKLVDYCALAVGHDWLRTYLRNLG